MGRIALLEGDITEQAVDAIINAANSKLHARMATDEAKALYKLRKQTVELSFADLKAHRALRRFSGKGLSRARTEVGLLVLAHNGLTVVRALETPRQLAA